MKFSEAGRIRQNRSETFVACDHMTAIEIRPYHRRPKVLEAPGVEPVFLGKHQAINYYAHNRASVGEEKRLRVKLPPTSDFGVT